ncbi:hypothetical protein KCTCHS21_50830 [Cohnella abietis]|uniref:GDP-mannose 4,6-dehydratase n=1 Tax=Cohnella abietis TaxID=2507935 RepID=A0A3T1DCC0_9BACL|nr:hypothetical protein KCTCHS21_50830 [Cohnella abietis]
MEKSALVTGIIGQDGSYLAELLLDKGYKVYGLRRRTSMPMMDNIDHIAKEVEFIDGDLMDQGSIARAVIASQLDARFYQASSSEMFGKAVETPQKETTPFYPRSPYGVAKVYGR